MKAKQVTKRYIIGNASTDKEGNLIGYQAMPQPTAWELAMFNLEKDIERLGCILSITLYPLFILWIMAK